MILRLMLHLLGCKKETKMFASSGNRTRAARVAGEHSTTEPTMPHESPTVIVQSVWAGLNVRCLINVNARAWMPLLWKMKKGLSQFECHNCGICSTMTVCPLWSSG